MKTVYMVRHQGGHYNTEIVFASKPTDAQRDAVLAHDDLIYGGTTTDAWRAHPACIGMAVVVEGDEVPKFDEQNALISK